MKLLDLCLSLGITPSEDFPYISQDRGGAIYKYATKPLYDPSLHMWSFDGYTSQHKLINQPDIIASDFDTTVLTMEDFNNINQLGDQSLELLLQRMTHARNERDKYYEMYVKANTDSQELETHIINLLKEHGLDIYNIIPF